MSTYPSAPPMNHVFLDVEIPDISSADQRYVYPGFRGKIKAMRWALNGAITGADADLTLKIGGTAVTGGVATVPESGSAAGDSGEIFPTAANTFDQNTPIEVETDGASTNAVAVVVVLQLEPV